MIPPRNLVTLRLCLAAGIVSSRRSLPSPSLLRRCCLCRPWRRRRKRKIIGSHHRAGHLGWCLGCSSSFCSGCLVRAAPSSGKVNRRPSACKSVGRSKSAILSVRRNRRTHHQPGPDRFASRDLAYLVHGLRGYAQVCSPDRARVRRRRFGRGLGDAFRR